MSHTNSTTNYGLPEFLSSDKPAWMADINTAFATIDTQMKANADSAGQANTDVGTMGLNFAPGYSNASTYAVGDIVTYNKRVYICDVAVTVPEAFDSDKWSYYRLSDVGETANEDHELIGNTDISSVGDGTLTGAVNTLNANLSELFYADGTYTIQAWLSGKSSGGGGGAASTLYQLPKYVPGGKTLTITSKSTSAVKYDGTAVTVTDTSASFNATTNSISVGSTGNYTANNMYNIYIDITFTIA